MKQIIPVHSILIKFKSVENYIHIHIFLFMFVPYHQFTLILVFWKQIINEPKCLHIFLFIVSNFIGITFWNTRRLLLYELLSWRMKGEKKGEMKGEIMLGRPETSNFHFVTDCYQSRRLEHCPNNQYSYLKFNGNFTTNRISMNMFRRDKRCNYSCISCLILVFNY